MDPISDATGTRFLTPVMCCFYPLLGIWMLLSYFGIEVQENNLFTGRTPRIALGKVLEQVAFPLNCHT